MSEPTLAEAVDLLRAVREALTIPSPATVGGGEVHDRILLERIRHARTALESVLDDGYTPPWDWTAEYLRERLAEHPAVGYVTAEQARAALAAGKPWSEAVNPDQGRDEGPA